MRSRPGSVGIDALFGSIDEAIDQVMTCRPDHLVLGISALSIWGGTPHASPHSASVTYNEGEFGRAARNSRKDGGWLARRLAFDERLGELVSRAKIRF